jgi:ribose transport system substrate-binding protein
MTLRTRIRAAGGRGAALTALGVVTAISLVGCGSSSSHSASKSGSAGQASTSASSGQAASAPASGVTAAAAALSRFTAPVTSYPAIPPVRDAASLKGKTVWFVPFSASLPDIVANYASMATALGHLGIHTRMCNGQFLPTTISSCLNQAVQQNASAVVTGYVDYKEVPAAMNNVTSHHIPLLVAGQSDDAGSGANKLLGFWNSNSINYTLARLAADATVAASNGKAQILNVGTADSSSLLKISTTIAQQVTASCPKCSIHEITFTTPEIQKLSSQVSAALIKYPDTNYVVVSVDTALPEVVQGIDAGGHGAKVKIITQAGTPAGLQAVKSGTSVLGDGGFNNAYIGWGFADGVIRMMLGKQPISYLGGIRWFNKQNVSNLSLTPAAFNSGAWYSSQPIYQEAFLKAWASK